MFPCSSLTWSKDSSHLFGPPFPLLPFFSFCGKCFASAHWRTLEIIIIFSFFSEIVVVCICKIFMLDYVSFSLVTLSLYLLVLRRYISTLCVVYLISVFSWSRGNWRAVRVNLRRWSRGTLQSTSLNTGTWNYVIAVEEQFGLGGCWLPICEKSSCDVGFQWSRLSTWYW